MGKESSTFGNYASLKTAKDGYKCSTHTAEVGKDYIRIYVVEDRGIGGSSTLSGGYTLKKWTPVGDTHFKASTAFRSISFTYTRGAWEFTVDGRTYRRGLPVCGPQDVDLFDSLFSLCTIL